MWNQLEQETLHPHDSKKDSEYSLLIELTVKDFLRDLENLALQELSYEEMMQKLEAKYRVSLKEFSTFFRKIGEPLKKKENLHLLTLQILINSKKKLIETLGKEREKWEANL